MTLWQTFIEGLGYLMLGDLAAIIFGCAYLLWKDRRERREVSQLNAMYAREAK